MSSADLFNQAQAKREEAQRCRDQAAELSSAGVNLGGSLGSVGVCFGPQTWLGPKATRVGRLIDDCFASLQIAAQSIDADARSMYLKARWLDEQAEVLESDARLMARAEAEAEAARQRALAEATAAQARAAHEAAQAAAAAAQAAAARAVAVQVQPGAAPVVVVVFTPIPPGAAPAPVPASGSSGSSGSSSGSEDDYSGWY